LYIAEGDSVSQGQKIALIKPSPEMDGKLNDAQLNVERAREDFEGKNNQLKNRLSELDAQKQQVELDSSQYMKLKNLWAQDIGSKLDLDRAKLRYETTASRYKVMRNQYEQAKKTLRINYEKALNALAADKESMAEYTIEAKINGIVYALYKEQGDLITPQERLAEIGSDNHFVVEMDVDEVDIAKIQLGDTAIVKLEAYPESVFQSTVHYISPKKNEKTQTFLVEGYFLDQPNRLYSGLSGEANIIVAKRTNSLVIPTDYLIGQDRVLTDHGVIQIKTGVKNMRYVEVLSGIDTSTTLRRPE
jgi:multidrug efflux pump subunit AcrA (membrane-fusion protein)